MRTETLFERIVRASNGAMFGLTFVALRVALGAQFFFSGIAKLNDWSAADYLAAASGPFAEWFQSLAGNGVVDALNAWGMIAIGLALILGLCVRPASIAGIALMTLYYLAHFSSNTESGFIDTHVVYAVIFLLFVAGGAGHAFGVNGVILHMQRRPNAVTRFLLG